MLLLLDFFQVAEDLRPRFRVPSRHLQGRLAQFVGARDRRGIGLDQELEGREADGRRQTRTTGVMDWQKGVPVGLRHRGRVAVEQEPEDLRLLAGPRRRKSAGRVQGRRPLLMVAEHEGRWIGRHDRLDGPERGSQGYNTVEGKVFAGSAALLAEIVPDAETVGMMAGVPKDGIVVVFDPFLGLPRSVQDQFVQVDVLFEFFFHRQKSQK